MITTCRISFLKNSTAQPWNCYSLDQILFICGFEWPCVVVMLLCASILYLSWVKCYHVYKSCHSQADFFPLVLRRKLPRTCWQSSILDVMHTEQSMFTAFTCPPSWGLEAMQHDRDTKRASSWTLPLGTGEARYCSTWSLFLFFSVFVMTLFDHFA